jgi:phosphate starvation-inducible PhoH-like protein
MRGRTFKNVFLVCDEAQNISVEQIKMLLTRIGENSKFVITGDTQQCDLPKTVRSGLGHCERYLQGVKGVGFVKFDAKEIVRHEIIGPILDALSKGD